MDSKKEAIRSLAREAALATQEEMLAVASKRQKITLGIPRETNFQEKRVALVPESVALLVGNGHEVLVETNAGKDSNYEDHDFSEAGAKIVYDQKEIYQSQVVIKVAPPSLEEVTLMPGKQTIISAIQLRTHPKSSLEMMMRKKITAIAWDYIKDETGIFPIVRAMGEIAGNTAVLIAAEYLNNANSGKGLMFGGISGVPPTEVVILGAGTVGEFAARAALGLGANVKVFDNSIYKLRRIQNDLGTRLWTSTIQPSTLQQALQTADVAIGAMRAPFGRTPCVVTEAMVQKMQPGAVIVDISVDQGGCFETSEVRNHSDPIFKKHDVVHYCVPNVASRVARTASDVLSSIFAPKIIEAGERGSFSGQIKYDSGIRNGVYIYRGTLVNEIVGEAFGIPYKDLGLLLAAIGEG